MKNKIAIASAFIAASSFSTAEIVVNDFLSFEGFVDMSYTHIDADLEGASESDNSFAIDQVEISWLFDFDPVTAQVDIEYEGSSTSVESDNFPGETGTGDGVIVEQAFATYHFDNGGAITAGRYASMIGFEAFEPTGLYQYSFGYDVQLPEFNLPFGSGIDLSAGDVTIIPGYAQGVKYTYETDTTFFGISLQDEVFDYDGDRLGGDDASSYGVEAAFSITMENGLSWFVGGAYEDSDEAEGDSYMLNTYVTFETGAWLFAAEVNYGESESDAFALGATGLDLDDQLGGGYYAGGAEEEALQALLMANFAYSDVASVTGRITYVDHELLDVSLEAIKFTIAHGYAFTDNLFLVNELSYVDGSIDGLGAGSTLDSDFDSVLFATELIFSF
jgi:hypothetical protein